MVTGGVGFLGSHLCRRLIREGHDVLAVDNSYTGTRKNVDDLLNNPRFELMRHDVTFPLYVEVDEIYNLACPASPIHYQNDPVQTTKTSVHGAINMLGLAKRLKAKILQASTSEVYGSSRYEPMDENHPTESQSPYAASKNSADELTKSYFRSFNLPIKIIRPFNAYGPRQSARAVIPNIIFQLNNKKIKKVKLGNLTPKRDYTYVEDLCDAYYKIYNLKKFGETYNVGTNEKISIKDLYNLISVTIGIKKEIIIENIRKRKKTSEVMSLRSNFNKLNKATGWKPKTSFVKGLKKTIIWVKKNQKIYKDIYNI